VNFDSHPQAAEDRRQRGLLIAKAEGQIRRVWEGLYYVRSQAGNGEYQVSQTGGRWTCSCPDFSQRHAKCKHVWAVEISLRIRHAVDGSRVIAEVSVSECGFCHSQSLKKFGVRHNVSGDIQRFACLVCHRTFSVNVGFEKMKSSPKAITTALQLYFSGESLRNTQKALRLLGVEISHRTILNLIRKYIGLMEKYVSQITPEVGEKWRADELYVKVKGDMKYLFAMMDDETRFWISQQVADSKYTADVRPLFAEAKERAGKVPLTLITDGGRHFNAPFRREFDSASHYSRHVKDITLRGKVHNNKMERMNGEVRDREKVMRGLKRTDTPILKGLQIYHNFVRPHEALDGRTPAEAAGIRVEGDDKWKTLIQNASIARPRATDIAQEQEKL
jgi:transposase-like protein